MTDPTASTLTPYLPHEPGDLLSAEDWNTMQERIRADIRATSQAAADGVTHVATADDARHLEGRDLTAVVAAVTAQVLDDVRGRTGYQRLFKVLKAGDRTVLEHGLGSAPLVDVYKLEYFPVVCREDDETRSAFATFYLHHTSERRVRVTLDDGTRGTIDVQPADFPPMGIPFADMLAHYHVPYTDTTTLDDLETEFWKALFRGPNDPFDDEQFCHSPWFERCCKEQQSVRQLKDNGDWDDMIFQVRPRKTVNFAGSGAADTVKHPRPADTFVQHLDNNRTAIWFEGTPTADGGEETAARTFIKDTIFDTELKVMVLLKV
jgi:hypothetical protein